MPIFILSLIAPLPVAAESSSPQSGGKPKGKDFSRMGGPPAVAQPPPPVVVPTQPPPVASANSAQMAESIRRQNAARVAAGIPPVVRPPSTVVPALVPQQLPPPTNFVHPQQQQLPQALKPNAPPHFKQQLPTSVPTLAQKQQAQQQEHMQRQLHSQMIQQQQQQQGAIAQSNISAINAAIQQSSQSTLIQQPTQRPSWSEARLSTMEIPTAATASTTSKSTSTNKKQDIYGNVSLAPILGEKLQTLCNSIDPSYTLDSEVQERLVEMADSFVDKVTKDAIKLAKHRGSNCMDVVDVALALKKGYNMSVPGLGSPSVAGSSTSGGRGMIGGWLFADKVNADGEQPPSKKRKTSGSAAAASM